VHSVAVLLFVGIVVHLWISASKNNKVLGPSRGTLFVTRPGSVLVILAVSVAGFLSKFRRGGF
jgi:hypothetical protein